MNLIINIRCKVLLLFYCTINNQYTKSAVQKHIMVTCLKTGKMLLICYLHKLWLLSLYTLIYSAIVHCDIHF